LLRAAPPVAAGKDDDHVGPQALELPLHELAGALPERNHGRDGRNADYDSQHGQAGAELVLGQCSEGDAESQEECHC
jgi:hypothetical protein